MVVKRAVERRRGVFACCVCRTARRRLSLILSVGGLASAMRPALWLGDPRRLWPSRLARFMNLLPVATALLAIGWLGESLQAYHLVGGGIALAGVLAAQTLKGKENVARGGATSS